MHIEEVMSFIADDIELNSKIKGKTIEGAASSLTMFTLNFDDGSGMLVQVTGDPTNPQIHSQLMSADELPSIGDAVCKIEWAWIVSSKIESVQNITGSIKFQLAPAGPLTVMAQVWNGSLFLSFMPYKAAS
jgi:hypothetical protein